MQNVPGAVLRVRRTSSASTVAAASTWTTGLVWRLVRGTTLFIPPRCAVIARQQQLPLMFSYSRGFPDSGICKPCSPGCASCQGDSSHCLSCEQQYLLQDHSCRSQCLKGYYPTEGECHRCPAHCITCTQDGLCTGEGGQAGLSWKNRLAG